MRCNRNSIPRAAVALGALVALPLSSALAQRRPPDPVPRVMVATFSSAEKDLGLKTAEELRNRITHDVDARKLVVIPKVDINKTLEASGYSTTEALASNDAKALASLLRADEYVEGVAIKTPTGVKIDARLVLARDQNIGQPLPSAEANKIEQAAAAVSKSYQAAREQLPAEKQCYSLTRGGKFAEAVAAGRAGLAKYPTGTIVMACLANAYQELKQSDSVLAIAERITAVDPRNIPALRWIADIYQTRGNTDKQTAALVGLMAADPSNERLRDQVIVSLVQAGKIKLARPFVEEAVRNNPGDPKTLGLAWRVYLADQDYEQALSTGAELIKADTSAADSTYYIRSAAAASQISPARAAEVVSQGIAKYPGNATLLLIQAGALNKAGQNAQALTAARRAVQINPRIEGGYSLLAVIYGAMNQPDSVMSVIRLALTAGGDKKTLAQVALKLGNDTYKAGNISKDRPTLQRAMEFLKLSDQLDPSPTAKFLLGVSAFGVAVSAVNDAQSSKSCTLARLAKESLATSQDNVPAGLQDYPDPAKQVLTAIPQYTPAVDEMQRRFCK